MNEYLSKDFIEKILDAHLEDSRGAEHYAYDIIKRELMAAPGADVKPVKRGKWISFLDGDHIMPERYYRCSCCGRVESRERPYCHCGANMSKES
jgi:hypothetical protein